MAKDTQRLLILGAAGRDFHNFNTCFRDDPSVRVVAFTATQIPGIAGRRYPPELAGSHYPDGIPIERQSWRWVPTSRSWVRSGRCSHRDSR